jgi:hypothetical protein
VIIRTSSAREIDRLLADLRAGDLVRRDAAVARLTILGRRAVERVIAALADAASPDVQIVALGVLEAIGDPRALAPARALLGAPDAAVALAALGVTRAHACSDQPEAAAAALDALAATAVDPARGPVLRTAALEALREAAPDLVDPLLEQIPHAALRLRQGLGGSADVRRESRGEPRRTADRRSLGGGGQADLSDLRAVAAIERLRAAAGDGLPADPADLRRLIGEAGEAAPLALLHQLIDALRQREREELPGPRRTEWAMVRAAVHQALAARGSRVALYDLRETLERADEPLPVGFLAAVEAIGDESCLEPLASAYLRSNAPREDWWRQHVAAAFRTLLQRGHLTRRHAVVRRMLTRWPALAGDLIGRHTRRSPPG